MYISLKQTFTWVTFQTDFLHCRLLWCKFQFPNAIITVCDVIVSISIVQRAVINFHEWPVRIFVTGISIVIIWFTGRTLKWNIQETFFLFTGWGKDKCKLINNLQEGGGWWMPPGNSFWDRCFDLHIRSELYEGNRLDYWILIYNKCDPSEKWTTSTNYPW